MHSKCDNIKIAISDKADEVIKELSESLKNRYKSMKGSKFVHFLYYVNVVK